MEDMAISDHTKTRLIFMGKKVHLPVMEKLPWGLAAGKEATPLLLRQSAARSKKRALGAQGMPRRRGGASHIYRKSQLGARAEDLGIGFSLVRSLLGLLELTVQEVWDTEA